MIGRAADIFILFLVLLLGRALCGAAALAEEDPTGETVTRYLTPEILQLVFPGADRTGPVERTPPAADAYTGNLQIGYVFSTWDATQSKGFSNRPLILLVGLGLDGRIAGARVVHHTEP